MYIIHLYCYEAKQANLELKTHQKELLNFLPLAVTLYILTDRKFTLWQMMSNQMTANLIKDHRHLIQVHSRH